MNMPCGKQSDHCRKEYVQVETWDYFDEVS